MVEIKNVMTGMLVCSLLDGSTLRLKVGETIKVRKDLIPKNVRVMESNGKLLIREIEDKRQFKLGDESGISDKEEK